MTKLVIIEAATLGPDEAEQYARSILTRVAEIRAMPPDGWVRCTKPPEPGAHVRHWDHQGRSITGVIGGTVLAEKARDPDRVVVHWTDGKVGEPTYESLIIKS